jgi:hypothetical protein
VACLRHRLSAPAASLFSVPASSAVLRCNLFQIKKLKSDPDVPDVLEDEMRKMYTSFQVWESEEKIVQFSEKKAH